MEKCFSRKNGEKYFSEGVTFQSKSKFVKVKASKAEEGKNRSEEKEKKLCK
ncbi:MAG: hypothetical protein Q4E35_07220 [Eubacteriales bacterium]|nr:hypothetical protein [Eubacteriales bacterium]